MLNTLVHSYAVSVAIDPKWHTDLGSVKTI